VRPKPALGPPRTRSPTLGRGRARPLTHRRALDQQPRPLEQPLAESGAALDEALTVRAPANVARPATIREVVRRERSRPWLTAFGSESKTTPRRRRRSSAARRPGRSRRKSDLATVIRVRLEAPVLERQQAAGAAEAGLDLVDAEERAEAAAELLRAPRGSPAAGRLTPLPCTGSTRKSATVPRGASACSSCLEVVPRQPASKPGSRRAEAVGETRGLALGGERTQPSGPWKPCSGRRARGSGLWPARPSLMAAFDGPRRRSW